MSLGEAVQGQPSSAQSFTSTKHCSRDHLTLPHPLGTTPRGPHSSQGGEVFWGEPWSKGEQESTGHFPACPSPLLPAHSTAVQSSTLARMGGCWEGPVRCGWT